MTVTFRFYNSLDHDRVYNATDFSKIFDGIINDGVFMSVGDHLAVTPNGGMAVAVGTGRAWFNGTWTNNDSPFLLTLDASSPTLNRIDLIVLEINTAEDTRTNSIKIIKGTAASVPSEPSLGNTSERFSYVLASIYVNNALTTITQSNITNHIGTGNTPFVTGILETVNTDDLLTQWEDEFQTWFDNLSIVLSGEVAGNLQVEIEANTELIEDNTENLQGQINDLAAITNMRIVARQGDSATDWSDPGVTNYSPIEKAVIQVGSTPVPTGQNGYIIVTFPIPFINIPLVLATVGSGTGGIAKTVDVRSVTLTGCVLYIVNHSLATNQSAYHTPGTTFFDWANWLAIGLID